MYMHIYKINIYVHICMGACVYINIFTRTHTRMCIYIYDRKGFYVIGPRQIKCTLDENLKISV